VPQAQPGVPGAHDPHRTGRDEQREQRAVGERRAAPAGRNALLDRTVGDLPADQRLSHRRTVPDNTGHIWGVLTWPILAQPTLAQLTFTMAVSTSWARASGTRPSQHSR